MNIVRVSLLNSLAILLLSAPNSPAGVLINEIMYHPASGNLAESYVELYNSGTGSTNLSGCRFTKGLRYAFPTNTILAPGAYLVVAADTNAFKAEYPGTLNFVAGFTPPLGKHVRLEDPSGKLINEVHFAVEGDWARRLLTTNGFASYGHAGWEWTAPHDGAGSSLELINPALPNAYGLNWTSSVATAGTPGRANSTAGNVAPLVLSVAHSPVLPLPSDTVTVSARLLDEHSAGTTATLFYRDATTTTPGAFLSSAMVDDGAHNDGVTGDGVFAAFIPPQPLGTVIEFYIQARDLEGNLRTYPDVVPPTNSLRTANLLYQVSADTYAGAQPVYRLVMTEIERQELYHIGRGCPDMDSDAQMNTTWISTDAIVSDGTTTQVRYNAGVRNRGHGTRSSNPNNYHVNIPEDRTWKNLQGINLNSQYAYSQVLGSAILRRLEIPMAESRPVQLRVNGTNLMDQVPNNSFGSYAANEQYNNDFIQRAFPLDPYGNSYRGIRDQTLCDSSRNSVADLTWHGSDFATRSYTNAYFKQNNFLQNDFSDVIDLIAVFNSANGYNPANYAQDVRRRINVDQWMQYMAANTLLDNGETCLANGTGDDYALYRGTNDTRFLALPYDLDTVLGLGKTPISARHSIFLMTSLPVMDRFMKEPQFAPLYYKWLKAFAESVFSPAQMGPLVDQVLGNYIPQTALDNLKAYNASQAAWVLSQIPLTLTASNNLPIQSGFPRATIATVALSGSANAIDTRSVLVNGSPAIWVAWQGTWSAPSVALSPGLNRILVQSLDANGLEFERIYTDVWYDDGSVVTVGGTIATDTTWSAAAGPYRVSTSLTIPSGVTLTIQPGTTVYLGSGVNFTVASGGRLLAEGATNQFIRFTTEPGSSAAWGGLTIEGAPGSPETRIAYAYFEGNGTTCIHVNGGTLLLDHTTFGTTTHQYVALDDSSFILSDCIFPTSSAAFELVHGTGGIKAGGHGIVRRCFFGSTSGYNDIMDFTGGNRDLNQPIIQYLNNVFTGASDDILDLDGTDAWIEGNIFMHVHKNGAPDSSSAVSGGDYNFGGTVGDRTSEITIIGNLFYDCDQAATAKQGNFFTLLNNTIVHTTNQGGEDTASGVVNVRDFPDGGSPTTFGAGYYLEGNIITDAPQLVRNYDPAQTTVTFNNNILPFAWTGPGASNRVVAPFLKHIPALSETHFTNFNEAQIMRDWFSLLPGSPARATGPDGKDLGGVIPVGASISGEPSGTNNQTTAVLHVGTLRSGQGIPVAGFPQGSGYVAYKWRLDDGPWSAETPIGNPITLAGLANGPHQVQVIGKRDSSYYQDDPLFGADATITSSRTWTVDPAYIPPAIPQVRINEVLAQNTTVLTNGGTTPDLIELHNYGPTPIDLSGMGLSDNPALPYKFTFPPATPLLAPGQFLTLYADANSTAPGTHLGFSLKANGDDLYLRDKASAGGVLIDSVQFGIQLPNFSIGRASDGSWVLCQPTFGSENLPLATGDLHTVKINEWLTDELFLGNHDFVELFNTGPTAVALGGTFLSNAEGAPALYPIPPLSFIAPTGYVAFAADNNPGQGADHLNFKLNPEVGIIILSDRNLAPIDIVNYGTQATDVAQGRTPSGSDTFAGFPLPTAGGPNPVPNGGTTSITNITSTRVPLLGIGNTWKYNNSGTDLGSAWSATAYDDSAWSSGVGLFGHETTPAEYPYPFRTYIPAPRDAGGHITVYYRTHFQWDGSLAQPVLVSTNYIDDGAVYYLNGARVGALRLSGTVTYTTLAGDQGSEGTPEILTLTGTPVVGDNVMAVEVHQVNNTSSDDVFGMELGAAQFTTNVIVKTVAGVPVALNEVLASNSSFTNAAGLSPDWIELYNTSPTNIVDLADLSLSNDPNVPRKFVFPAGASIAPGGFLLVYCDNSLPASATNSGFSLNATGDAIYLFNRPENGSGLLDAVSFGLQATDFSIGRVPNGTGPWQLNIPSAAAPNTAAALGTYANLSINEWMADPAAGSDWFELYNAGQQPVALGGLYLTDDLAKKTVSPVQPLSFIGTGSHGFAKFVADSNPQVGANHVAFSLSKFGEDLGLYSPAGLLINGLTFGPQQTGVSQGRFPDGSATIVSFVSTPSPDESNYLPIPNVVINEALSHTDPPLEDAIELYNSGVAPVDISGWFLSNSLDDLRKFRVPDNTTIPNHGFRVFYEGDFGSTQGVTKPFTLNSAHGDPVYLSEADAAGTLTGRRAVAVLGAAANGVSFGRYTNSIGQVDYVPLVSPTFGMNNPASVEQFRTGTGALNSPPRVGPIVISEIMFFPPLIGGTEDDTLSEFVELQNLSSSAVPLFDPAATTNAWKIKGGIDFSFPTGTSLAPGGTVLIVNFDPALDQTAAADFRSRYNLAPVVPLFGPYAGRLSNSGETVALYKPDPPQVAPHPDAGFVPDILVDKLDYSSIAPWPINAAGTGSSLQRLDVNAYGNDPANWFVAAPTPGKPNRTAPEDANGDGLPDAWQVQFFGSADSPDARPGADPDNDGYTNLQEYLAGTAPNDPNSRLQLNVSAPGPGGLALSFSAVAGRTYSILYAPAINSGAWLKLADVAAQPQTRPITINDPAPANAAARFYRLVTPALP